jgi:phage tail-like protein
MSETALALRFAVTIDGLLLGDWTKCDGLSIEYDVTEYREGGENGFVHRLAGRAKYTNIKLTRPINSGSAEVAAWVASVSTKLIRQTAQIAVMDAAGNSVVAWNLVGVYPVRWTGPTLDVGGNQVAYETLELAHHGLAGNLS